VKIAHNGHSEKVRVLTLAEIAERTGIPRRALRYVLDHDVLPVAEKASKGRGTAREFDERDALLVAAAALMFSGGLRRQTVKETMDLLHTTEPRRNRYWAERAYDPAEAYERLRRIEIGDGVNIRPIYGPLPRVKIEEIQMWRQAGTDALLAADYRPLITVTIDMEKLRERLLR
jgi:hypothetical protein